MAISFGDFLVYFASFFGIFTSLYFFITYIDNLDDIKDQKITKYPKVTIAVPAYNEEKTLLKTVNSLINLDYPKDKIEIIIIDDGSKDKTLEIANQLKKENKNIIVIHQKNAGKGHALNKAIQISSGEFFGCLDADSFADKNALKAIMSRFNDPKTMAVTPSMKLYEAHSILEMIQDLEYRLGIFLRKIFGFLGGIHVTPGPFSFFRKTFFEKYGGYDENNPTEDIEIALRIQSKGYQIENSLDAHVYTIAPKKFKILLKQRLRWYQGFFLNLEKYNHLFRKKTGNLGIFLLPFSLISIALAITLLGYTLYLLIKNSIDLFKTISNLGWDYFKTISFEIDFFKFGNHLSFLLIITLIVTIIIMLYAKKMSGKTDKFILKFFIFSLFYWILYGFWWFVAILYKVFGKRVKWGTRKI